MLFSIHFKRCPKFQSTTLLRNPDFIHLYMYRRSLTFINITRIIKNIPNKMKEDVGMSKPKKQVNKVELNKLLPYTPPYISPYTAIKQNTKSCTYVGLYESGLFNSTLFTCFLGFDIPTSSFILFEMFFIILVSIVFFFRMV